jgi:oligopeptide/dipeptide ABC transporter ATP-binding protein
MSSRSLLHIEDLVVEFVTENGRIRAVDQLGLEITPGEIVGLVGESGCGKSVTALALMGLVPSPPGKVSAKTLEFEGRDLSAMTQKDMAEIRGTGMAMIFQEPMTALDPVFTIASQMTEVLKRQCCLSADTALKEAVAWLDKVGIPEPEKQMKSYPHELSGGMRQRVMIAMALSCKPRLLIADEPTTALDVTIQAQVMELMVSLARDTGTAMLLITHDLGVVAETCDRACVMYCGRMVEQADIKTLFEHPRHHYTAGLLASVPRLREEKLVRLPTIPGVVPDPARLPAGCAFNDRCPAAKPLCQQERPVLETHAGSLAACHFPAELS